MRRGCRRRAARPGRRRVPRGRVPFRRRTAPQHLARARPRSDPCLARSRAARRAGADRSADGVAAGPAGGRCRDRGPRIRHLLRGRPRHSGTPGGGAAPRPRSRRTDLRVHAGGSEARPRRVPVGADRGTHPLPPAVARSGRVHHLRARRVGGPAPDTLLLDDGCAGTRSARDTGAAPAARVRGRNGHRAVAGTDPGARNGRDRRQPLGGCAARDRTGSRRRAARRRPRGHPRGGPAGAGRRHLPGGRTR